MKLKVTVNQTAYEVDVEVAEEAPQQLGAIVIGGKGGSAAAPAAGATGASANAITAPLAGSVFKILCKEGDEVKAGQVVVILEAMKMETEITAPKDGTVAKILVDVSTPVQGGQALVELA